MAQLFKFRFDYGFTPTAEQVAAMQPYVTETIDVEKKGWHTYTGDIVRLLAAAPGVKIEVDGGEVPGVAWLEIVDRLTRIEQAPSKTVINERCNVTVPGLGLLLIDEVNYLLDACTEVLQERLAAGWRILAICPQPDQRRPDYVLGRTQGQAPR